MVGDQTADPLRPPVLVQVGGAVEGMEPGVVELAAVADVVQPGGDDQQPPVGGSTVTTRWVALLATPTVCAHRSGRSCSSVSATVRATLTRELVAVMPTRATLWAGPMTGQ